MGKQRPLDFSAIQQSVMRHKEELKKKALSEAGSSSTGTIPGSESPISDSPISGPPIKFTELVNNLKDLQKGKKQIQDFNDPTLTPIWQQTHANSGSQKDFIVNAVESTLDFAGDRVPTRIKNAWEKGKLQGEMANIIPIASRPDAESLGIADQIAAFNRSSDLIPVTPEMKKLDEEGVVWAFKNPVAGAKAIGETIISSLAAQLKASERTSPGAVAIGAATGSIIPGLGTIGGAVSGLTAGQVLAGLNVESSSTFLQTIKDAGFPVNDEKKLAEAFADKRLVDKARSLGIKRGIPIAIFDMLTAGIGGRVAASASKSMLGSIGKIGAVAGIEAAGGSAGELAAQVNAGQEIDLNAVALEGIAELGAGAPALATETAKAVYDRKNTSSSNENIVKQVVADPETGVKEATENLERNLNDGIITPEDFADGMSVIDKVSVANSKIPPSVEGEKREKTIDLITTREELVNTAQTLEAQKADVDPAYHPMIDEEIKEANSRFEVINKQIQDLAKPDKKPSLDPAEEVALELDKFKKPVEKTEDTKPEKPTISEISKESPNVMIVKPTSNVQAKNNVIDSLDIQKLNSELKNNGIDGKLLNGDQSAALQREIESNYSDEVQFGSSNNDIRKNAYNYDNPIAEKTSNGVNLRIAAGLKRDNKSSYLLYADGVVVGEFSSVGDAKTVIKFIEDNLVKKLAPESNPAQTSISSGRQVDDIVMKPISGISTDPERFQPRGTDFSAESRDKIVNAFDNNKLDPIVLYKDKDGKEYVLSGHSRLAAHEDLSKLPDNSPVKQAAIAKGFEPGNVKARYFQGSLAEAMEFADRSNDLGTKNKDYESAASIRKLHGKMPKSQIISRAKEDFGRNWKYIVNLSYLNPKGQAVDMMKTFDASGDKAAQSGVEKIASWIGAARSVFGDQLTNSHENEMFEFLLNNRTDRTITTENDFIAKVQGIIGRLDRKLEDPLNLARIKNKSLGETAFESEHNELNTQIKTLEDQMDKINDRFNNVNNREYVNPNAPDYQALLTRADKKKQEIKNELQVLRKELLELRQNRSKYISEGLGQGGLFDMGNLTPSEIVETNELLKPDGITVENIQEYEQSESITEPVSGNTEETKNVQETVQRPENDQSTNEGQNNDSERVSKPEVSKEAEIRARIAEKSKAFRDALNKNRGNLNSGFAPDPEVIKTGIELLSAYADLGIYKFNEIVRELRNDLGDDFFDTENVDALKGVYSYARSNTPRAERDKFSTEDEVDDFVETEFAVKRNNVGKNYDSVVDSYAIKLDPKQRETVKSIARLLDLTKRKEFNDVFKYGGQFIQAQVSSGVALSSLESGKNPNGSKADVDELMAKFEKNLPILQELNNKQQNDDTNRSNNLEPNSSQPSIENNVGPTDVQPVGTGNEQAIREGGQQPSETVQTGQQDNTGSNGSTTDGARAGSDTKGNGERQEPVGAFSTNPIDPRSVLLHEAGVRSEPDPRTESEQFVERSGSLADKSVRLAAQKKASESNQEFKLADMQNIVDKLPYLLDHQIEDVKKAEDRLYVKNEKGILFTNGTGTGKTLLGAGKILRALQMGKRNIGVIVPTDKKAKDWIEEAALLGIKLVQVKDTKDAGAAQFVTTYANFRDNEDLQRRELDEIYYDESHKIMSNIAGTNTSALYAHRKISHHPSVSSDTATENIIGRRPMDDDEAERVWYKKRDENKELIKKETERLEALTKVVFLSATPFSYHKNLEYADGYLFQMSSKTRGEGGYNSGSGSDQFYMSNFGYRMRYNKLTEPESGVDVNLMERQFADRLIKSGAMSTRKIQIPQDYSREFVLVHSTLGSQIDEGYRIMLDRERYKYLHEAAGKKFDYLYSNQLLESIKAQEYTERIQKHLELGRKVVLFHSYNNSAPSHPFEIGYELFGTSHNAGEIQKELRAFYRDFPEYRNLELDDLKNPRQTMVDAFGDRVVFFNGEVPKKKRSADLDAFNRDNGPDIIMVQIEAGKEGISLHDRTGVKPRVLINLGLPTKPTDAIQSEGRTYREGLKSNAPMEYPVLHTNFEKYAFATKIAERVRTAENLAVGSQARNLETAFKEGYLTPIEDDPHTNQGIGGKESDNVLDNIDEYEKSKTYYWATKKRTSKNKSQEGQDYFATPEPLGYKMVQWLDAKPNDDLLEPSAGHGAIGRFFPGDTNNDYIEPSLDLRSQLAINVERYKNIIDDRFENLNIINKYNGIAMNPPFGSAGRTAIDHVEKAFNHIYDKGRIVAIIPEGSARDKFDKWYTSEAGNAAVMIAEILLPSVTFERAGTGVSTRVVIIDKILDKTVRAEMPDARRFDLRDISDINGLFDSIKDIDVSPRGVSETASLSKPVNVKAATEVVKSFHAKNQKDIWVIKMNDRFEYADFNTMKQMTNNNGGYYSAYKGQGAIPGFVFDNEQDAQKTNNEIQEHFFRNKAENGSVENIIEQTNLEYIVDQSNIKNVLDFLDKAKIDKGRTYSSIIPPSLWNAAIDAMKAMIIASNSVQKGIRVAVRYLQDNGASKDQTMAFAQDMSERFSIENPLIQKMNERANMIPTIESMADDVDRMEEKLSNEQNVDDDLIRMAKSKLIGILSEMKKNKVMKAGVADAEPARRAIHDVALITDRKSLEKAIESVKNFFLNVNTNKKLSLAKDAKNVLVGFVKSNPLVAGKTIKDFTKLKPEILTNEELDEYNDIALILKNQVRAKATAIIDNETIEQFTNKVNDRLEKKAIEELAKKYKNKGITADMTLDQIRDALTNKNDTESAAPSGGGKSKKRELVETVIEENREELSNIKVDPENEEIVAALMEVPLDRFSVRSLVELNNAITNVIYNDRFVGYGPALIMHRALNNVDAIGNALDNLGYEKGKTTGTAASFRSLDFNIENMTKSTKGASIVQQYSGIADISSGNAKVRQDVDDMDKRFQKLIEQSGKNIQSPKNRYKRGILAALLQYKDPAKKAEYFARYKKYVEETATILSKSSNNAERREGNLIKGIYDQFVSNAANVEEVIDLMNQDNPANMRIIEFFQDNFANKYDELRQNSEVFGLKDLQRFENYTPTSFKKYSESIDADDVNIPGITETLTQFGTEGVDKDQSRTTIDRKNIRSLNDIGRVMNLDFDSLMYDKYREVTYDVETLESRYLFDQIRKLPEYSEVMGGKKNVAVIAEGVKNMVQRQKGFNNSDPLARTFIKYLNVLTAKGVRVALYGGLQTLKQYPSVAVNTIMNLGVMNIDLFPKAIARVGLNNPIFDEFGIGLRGSSRGGTQFELEMKRMGNVDFGNDAQRAINHINRLSDKVSEFLATPLQFSDEAVAKHSWISYYMLDLRKRGIDIDSIDWTKEYRNPDKEAAAYAEQMVSRNQVVNDQSKQANMLYNTQDFKTIFKNIIAPLSSFSRNAQARLENDIRKFRGGNKKEAIISMTSSFVEQAAFNSIKLGIIGWLINAGASAVLSSFGFEEPEEKDMEERLKNVFGNTVNDFALSGFGQMGNYWVLKGLNSMYAMITDKKDDQLIFQYDPTKYGDPDFGVAGMYGILPERLYQIGQQVNYLDGTVSDQIKNSDGELEKVYSELTEDQQKLMWFVFSMDALGIMGISDADLLRLNQKVFREVKKQKAPVKINRIKYLNSDADVEYED